MVTSRRTVYVGCGRWGEDVGRILVFSLDMGTAELDLVQALPTGGVQSFMARSRDGHHVYVADEGGGLLSCYAVVSDTGRLEIVNQVSCAGHPVYIALDARQRALVTCFFGEGKTQVFQIAPDGMLGTSSCLIDSGRESHCAAFEANQKYVFVPTRGDDWIAQYRFDSDELRLSPNEPPYVHATPQAGPRHLIFHPNARWAYLVNELSRSLSVYALDPDRGTLQLLASDLPTTPNGNAEGDSADVHIHPGGKLLFVSNRQGARSNIAIFEVNEHSGSVTLLGHEPSRGKTPRSFALDPEGNLLLVANQDSNDVTVFRVDPRRGALSFVRSVGVTPNPLFVGIY